MGKETVTVYDIAREAGVSPATVSRVLTGNAKVSEDKRDRVQDIIKKYNFEPNSTARSLSKQEVKTIGMIVPDIRNPFYSTLFVYCEMEATRCGYNMILCNTINEISSEGGLLRNLMEKRVDAIIQVGGSVDEVTPDPMYIELLDNASKKIPTVIAGELESANAYRIIPETTHGMNELLTYLSGLGHKEIAFIGGRASAVPTLKKRQALYCFLQEKNLPFYKEFMIETEYSIEAGYEAAKKLLKLDHLPTAIIAVNESVAIGIIRALGEKRLRVPEDISVIGYDDTFYSEMISPPLTCISYNLKAYAQVIMETILQIINKEEIDQVKYIPTYLKVRGSCKDLRGSESVSLMLRG